MPVGTSRLCRVLLAIPMRPPPGAQHPVPPRWAAGRPCVPPPLHPGGMPATLAPPGAVNGLLFGVIKMELKINSLLQHAAVVAKLRAADFVPGLVPESGGAGAEAVSPGCWWHGTGCPQGARRAAATTSHRCHLAGDITSLPLTMCHVLAELWPGRAPAPALPASPGVCRQGQHQGSPNSHQILKCIFELMYNGSSSCFLPIHLWYLRK